LLLGCSHKSAPLHVREKFSISPQGVPALYNEMKRCPDILESVVLNTCNRVELYSVIRPGFCFEGLAKFFCAVNNVNQALFKEHSFEQRGKNVIMHAFSVASGIESQMVGETEIFGQFKEAYMTAKQHTAVGPTLNRIFQKSFQAAKLTRTHTDISRGQISIGNVATALAERIFAKLSKVRILIIGGGEAAEKTLQALYSRGAQDINITNRTFEKAQELARKFHARAIGYEDYPYLLDQFDVIISSISTEKPILEPEIFYPVMKKRKDAPMFLIDLGVPRNFDAGVADVPDVYLYNINDLANIANENLKSRQFEIEKCKALLAERVDHLWNTIVQKGAEQEDFSEDDIKKEDLAPAPAN